MYFSGRLEIDPAEMTEFRRVKPTKAFGKLCYYLTAGLAGSKREVETFTAVSILQQLNMAMRSLGIDNIVRLAVDDVDIYLDTEGRSGDLQHAMESFAVGAGHDGMADFQTLALVVEHHDADFKYLIDVHVDRVHGLHEYPITLVINGIVNELSLSDGDTADGLIDAAQCKKHLVPFFADNQTYKRYTGGKKHRFDIFVEQVRRAISEQIHVDNVISHTRKNILRPKARIKNRSQVKSRGDSDYGDPIFYDYYGFDSGFFYCWLWSELCYDYGIHISETTIVDDGGHDVIDIGATGFDAGEVATLDPDVPICMPETSDAVVHGDNAYADELAPMISASSAPSAPAEDDSDIKNMSVGESDSGSSWLGSLLSGGDDSSGGGASCGSSCGSSCGGGCGGSD